MEGAKLCCLLMSRQSSFIDYRRLDYKIKEKSTSNQGSQQFLTKIPELSAGIGVTLSMVGFGTGAVF